MTLSNKTFENIMGKGENAGKILVIYRFLLFLKQISISYLRLGQTGKWICYGGKMDKTCRIQLSGEKIHLL